MERGEPGRRVLPAPRFYAASPSVTNVDKTLEHQDEEWLSRRQAAERLVDIAYALTAGGPLEVSIAGRRVKVPVAAEVRLGRELRSSGDELHLELELTWSNPETG